MKKYMTAAAIALASATSLAALADETQTRDVRGYDKIYLSDFYDLDITTGSDYSLKITTNKPELLADIETVVEDGRLQIKRKKDAEKRSWKKWRNVEVKIKVTMPSIEAVKLAGSGDIVLNNKTGKSQDSFLVNLSGSGDVEVYGMSASDLHVDLRGSGDISMDKGVCTDLEVELRGSGDIDLGEVQCKTVEIDLRGSGDMLVYASEKLDANVRGSGDIVVYGSPASVSKSTRGSGDIYIK